MGNMMEQRAGFKSMTESTKADWDIIVARHQPFAADLSNRVIGHLKLLGGDTGGFAVDRLQHSLLTATLGLSLPFPIPPALRPRRAGGSLSSLLPVP